MQKVIDQISDQLVGLIKTDRPVYTPKELLRAGIPRYIIERIRLVLEDRIREEIKRPETKWANVDSELVEQSWEDFINSILSHSHVPHQELYNLIHLVVEDVILVFLEPRKRVTDYLFRENEVLSFAEMSRRCKRLTIYKHFGTAIPLYMKKRNLDEITRERCQQLIRNLDERLVANYTADDWAQKLEMLFGLSGGKVEPKLFTIFFEDKGLFRAAKVFSEIDVPLTKSSFIEMLTRDGISMLVEKEEASVVEMNAKKVADQKKQSQAKEEEKKATSSAKKNETKKDNPISLVEQFTSAPDSKITEVEMDDILSDIALGGVIEVDSFDDSESLNALFALAEQKEEEAETREDSNQNEEMQEFRVNLTSILDQAKDSFEGVVGVPEKEEEKAPEPSTKVAKEENIEVEDEVESFNELIAPSEEEKEDEILLEGEAKPMWAQFLSPEQMAVIMGSSNGEGEDDEPDSKEEPTDLEDVEKIEAVDEAEDEDESEILVEDQDLIIDENDSVEASVFGLKIHLSDKAKEFIDGIFDGAVWEYGEALEHLEQLDEWDDAVKYIQEEIFTRNNTDMFSEVAVEFTDRLQSYFRDHKWR